MGDDGGRALLESADRIKKGHFCYFFSSTGQLGFPPDWHLNPFTDQHSSPNVHWSDVPMFSPATGDLKFIWEPGRFAAAYTLARAYWLTGDESYAESFWQLLESWTRANPPNSGAHWRCGQETSLRLMALCFAFHAFADSEETTPARVALLVGSLAAQADRVAEDHVYARLQRNNHAISEAVGLWTVGILFPELRKAAKWRELGREILEFEAARQIYEDGAYVQHATNYHRLILHDFIWAIRLGELNGYELTPELKLRVRRAGDFLLRLQDPTTGMAPNYGNNDGALILPLNGCDYRDFRPVLGAVHYLSEGERLYQSGPWDEDLVWLFGPSALDAEPSRDDERLASLHAPTGGYFTLRGRNSWGLTRCATYQDRPYQADMLHLDIWRKGVNIACDPGTYLYYADPPWNNSLVSTLVHNTVSVDGEDQMTRGPRSLWLTWIKSRALYHLETETGTLGYFEGSHDGYTRLSQPVTHRRAILRAAEDVWIIVDDLTGEGEHDFRLHWLMADYPFKIDATRRHVILEAGEDRYGLTLFTCLPSEPHPVEFDVVRGTAETAPRGWRSEYYGVRHPAVSAALKVRATTPCRMVSVFAPDVTGAIQPTSGAKSPSSGKGPVSVSAERISWFDDDVSLKVDLLPPGSESIVRTASFISANRHETLRVE
jgi:asparagine synthase (glutamine-hydrolysing)